MERLKPSKPFNILKIGFIVSLVINLLLIVFSIAMFLEKNASNKLLDMLALAQPDMKLTSIKEQFNAPLRVENDLEKVIEWGSIKNKEFCKGKKLHSFYAVTPTCRAIDVYTDANDMIIFATWHQL